MCAATQLHVTRPLYVRRGDDMMKHSGTLKWRNETITSSSKVTSNEKYVKSISPAPLIRLSHASVHVFTCSHKQRVWHAICYWWHAAFDIRVLIYSVQHDEHVCSDDCSADMTD